MFEKNLLGQNVNKLRVSKNLNQQALADVLGVSYHAISKIENGQRAASIEVLYALADYFEVSIDYLVGRTDNPVTNQ